MIFQNCSCDWRHKSRFEVAGGYGASGGPMRLRRKLEKTFLSQNGLPGWRGPNIIPACWPAHKLFALLTSKMCSVMETRDSFQKVAAQRRAHPNGKAWCVS